MQPADNVQFRYAQMEGFAGFLNNLLNGKLKTIGIPLLSRERTKLATQNAIVGIIDVTINDIAGPVADFSLPGEIGDRSDGVQILALEQPQRIGFGNSLSGGNLLIKVPQFAALDKEPHEV
jgi:hypothetical protein